MVCDVFDKNANYFVPQINCRFPVWGETHITDMRLSSRMHARNTTGELKTVRALILLVLTALTVNGIDTNLKECNRNANRQNGVELKHIHFETNQMQHVQRMQMGYLAAIQPSACCVIRAIDLLSILHSIRVRIESLTCCWITGRSERITHSYSNQPKKVKFIYSEWITKLHTKYITIKLMFGGISTFCDRFKCDHRWLFFCWNFKIIKRMSKIFDWP